MVFRRRALVVLALALGLGLAACGDDDGGGGGGADEPLRLGVLTSLSGPQGRLGEEQVDAIELFVQQNPKIGGREVELLVEDDETDPDAGLDAARKLLDEDKVDIVTGVVNSAVLAAVQDPILARQVPLVVANAGLEEFTAEEVDPYAFRVSFANGQLNRALGAYAYDELGLRRVAALTLDYEAGEQHFAGFEEVFTSLGGEIVDVQRPPLGAADFGPFLSRLPTDVDAVYAFVAGEDALRFWQQARSFGLTEKVKIIGPVFTTDELLLQMIGPAAIAADFVGSSSYLSSLKLPENEQFSEAYRAKTKREPTTYASNAYIAMQAIAAGLKESGGELGDAFTEALAGVEFDSPQGPFRFDENHQVVFTVRLFEPEKNGDSVVPRIVDEIPDVDQNWTPDG